MFLKLTFVNATSFRRPGEGDGGEELVGPWRPLRPLNSWKGGRDDPLGKIRSTQDVGNLPGTAGAPPRLPLPHRQLGVPAALQRHHDLHVRLQSDRLGQAVRRQPHRLHSHQGHSRGKRWGNIVWFTCSYVIAVKIKLLIYYINWNICINGS